MFANRKMNLILIGTLAIGLIFVLALAVAPSAAAPTTSNAYPDYAKRHPGLSNRSIEIALGSDYFQRQKDLGNISIAKAADLTGSDYYERQVGLGNLIVGKKVDLSWPSRPDFSILNQKASVADTSDYSVRHPEMSNSTNDKTLGADWYDRHGSGNAADTSDYFQRH